MKIITMATKIFGTVSLGLLLMISITPVSIAETFSIGGTALNTNNQFPLKDGHPIMSTWPLSLTDNDQQFDRLSGNLLKHRSTGKCLNAYQPSPGSIVNVYPCNLNDPDQKFTILPVGNINLIQRIGTNFCLSMPGRSSNLQIALQACNNSDTNQRFSNNAIALNSIPNTLPAKQALAYGKIVDSTIQGSTIKDILGAVNQNIIRPEVGLFLISLLATESRGGNWQANNGVGYLGAFQVGVKERNAFAPGVSDAQFLSDKIIQMKTAQKLYDEKLRIVRTSNLSVWTTEPDKKTLLSIHFQGKSELYQVAYAWLTLYGIDGNNVYSKDYASAAEQTAILMRKNLGI
jgi:hypothetical protein